MLRFGPRWHRPALKQTWFALRQPRMQLIFQQSISFTRPLLKDKKDDIPSAGKFQQPGGKPQQPPPGGKPQQPGGKPQQPPPSGAKSQPPSSGAKPQPPPSSEAKPQQPPSEAKPQPSPSSEAKPQQPPSSGAKPQPPPSEAKPQQPPSEAKPQQPPSSGAKPQPPPSEAKPQEPPASSEAKSQQPPSEAKPQEPPASSEAKPQEPPSSEVKSQPAKYRFIYLDELQTKFKPFKVKIPGKKKEVTINRLPDLPVLEDTFPNDLPSFIDEVQKFLVNPEIKDPVVENLVEFQKMYKTYGDKLFPSPSIPKDNAGKIMQQAWADKFHPISCLFIAGAFKRQSTTQGVIDAISQFLEVARVPFVKFIVTTAKELNDEAKKHLEAEIIEKSKKNKLNQSLVFEYNVDPNLIGGFKLVFDDVFIDYSHQRGLKVITECFTKVLEEENRRISRSYLRLSQPAFDPYFEDLVFK